jgi:hypothetical protein
MEPKPAYAETRKPGQAGTQAKDRQAGEPVGRASELLFAFRTRTATRWNPSPLTREEESPD